MAVYFTRLDIMVGDVVVDKKIDECECCWRYAHGRLMIRECEVHSNIRKALGELSELPVHPRKVAIGPTSGPLKGLPCASGRSDHFGRPIMCRQLETIRGVAVEYTMPLCERCRGEKC